MPLRSGRKWQHPVDWLWSGAHTGCHTGNTTTSRRTGYDPPRVGKKQLDDKMPDRWCCAMAIESPVEFVKTHGVVMETAKGPVPTLAHALVGEPIRGSWWSHPKSHSIHAATLEARGSGEILTCRIVRGKVTLVHRRLWPALVRVARDLPVERLASVREIHTQSGAHRVEETPFPGWVPGDVKKASRRLTRDKAIKALGTWVLQEIRDAAR